MMPNVVRATTDLDNAERRRFAMNRRATLMLVIGGVVGIASPSAGTEVHKKRGGRRDSNSTANEIRGARDTKTRSSPPFQNLKEVGLDRQLATIHYDKDTYKVTTADGRSTDFWEANLRFKIDSSDFGPLAGKPVILPSGMMGDRASVFFASPGEMSALIKHQG